MDDATGTFFQWHPANVKTKCHEIGFYMITSCSSLILSDVLRCVGISFQIFGAVHFPFVLLKRVGKRASLVDDFYGEDGYAGALANGRGLLVCVPTGKFTNSKAEI